MFSVWAIVKEHIMEESDIFYTSGRNFLIPLLLDTREVGRFIVSPTIRPWLKLSNDLSFVKICWVILELHL